jgi:uncharacterized protein (DUF433 family)
MVELSEAGEKITVSKIAKVLSCSSRSIYRIFKEYPKLKQEKIELNHDI